MKILLTGAGGFIGSAFVRRVISTTTHHIRALVRSTKEKALTHRLSPVLGAEDTGRLELIRSDLLGDISGICENCDVVVHAAAKTFVDHSILDPYPFVEANIVGTHRILEDARRYKVKRFIHVSTDEVYGAILEGAYKEDARLNPTNPYSAAKAGADCLTISYAHTFGMHTVITRTENNYGPYQHPQKVFPVFVGKAMKDESLPVYGDGKHVRQWLWVDDHVDALLLLATHPDVEKGGIYHIAGNKELQNIELATKILDCLGKPHSLINFIDDHDIRPGHDRRYALNSDKLRALGWAPKMELDRGIKEAVDWYATNNWWHG